MDWMSASGCAGACAKRLQKVNVPAAVAAAVRSANPNAMTAYDGTPLHSATMWQHTELIRALLDAGADPSATDAQGRRPSAYAKGVALELLEQ